MGRMQPTVYFVDDDAAVRDAISLLLSLKGFLSQVFASALRWREISADCGASLSVAQAVRYCMIGSFFNQTLPSSIGGDAMRLWLVGRGPAGWRAAAYSIFVDRAIGHVEEVWSTTSRTLAPPVDGTSPR